MTPAVSVILPVHNRVELLPRAIGSVLDQRFTDFELIIIDDGSTDRSSDAARSWKDDRIRIIDLPMKRGGGAARNVGIRAARAPLIAFLDSDDAYLPDKLEFVVAAFENQPGLDVLIDSFEKVQPPGSVRARLVRRNPVINDQNLFRTALFRRLLWKATPSITVRREAIERSGLFDESLGRLQDFDLLIRLSENAVCASTDQVLWVKYSDPNSISAQDTLIPANVELCRRNPHYLSTEDYRRGLGFSLGLSLRRRIRSADFTGAVQDLRTLAQAFGTREAASLFLEACRPRSSS